LLAAFAAGSIGSPRRVVNSRRKLRTLAHAFPMCKQIHHEKYAL
jgi:hypothetical protein